MLGKMSQGGVYNDPITGLTSLPLDGQFPIYTAGFASLPTVEATILAVLTGIVTWTAISDLMTGRVPNTANAAILLLWIGWAIVNPNAAILYSLGIGIAVFVAGAVLFNYQLMGGGDVKLLAVLALFAGPGQVLPFLLYVSLFGGLLCAMGILQARFPLPVLFTFSLVTTTHGKRTVPYGVAIAAGAYIMIAGLWSG